MRTSKKTWFTGKIFLAVPFIIAVVICMGYGISKAQDVTIKTPSTLYVLKDPSVLMNRSDVLSAARTVELATGELTQATEALRSENKAIAGKIADHNVKVDDLDSRKNKYSEIVTDYNSKLEAYQQRVDAYTSQLNANDAQIAQFNSLPAEQRDQATANTLNAEHYRLASVKTELDQEYYSLTAQHSDAAVMKSNLEQQIQD